MRRRSPRRRERGRGVPGTLVGPPPAAPPAGELLGGSWIVLEPVETPAPFPVVRLRGEDGTPAIGVLLGDDGPDPVLDEDLAALWNVSRRVLRDPVHGRVLVDELPEGPGIVDDADGIAPPGPVEELSRKVQEAHRRGVPHGLLVPALVVRGPEGVAAAGWGILVDPREEAVARDLAALGALEGSTGRIPAEGTSPGVAAETVLRPALFSDHLPTLAAAIERAREAGVPEDDPLFVRARDALARLEGKVEACLASARERLERGDPLGAVAACREAIRLGAEEEAGPLLTEARRQARRLVGKPGVGRRVAWLGAAAAVLLVAVVLAVVSWGGGEGDDADLLLARAERMAEERGARAAATLLLGRWRESGGAPSLEEPIEALLRRTAREERERLLALRREVVRRGGRPRRADRLADRALEELDRVAAAGLSQPNPDLRLARALLEVDRAASFYRAATVLTAAQAASAVDGLLRVDPVFAPAGAEEGGR